MVVELLLRGASAYFRETRLLELLKHAIAACVVAFVVVVVSYISAFLLYSVLYYFLVPIPTFEWPLYLQQGSGGYPKTVLSLVQQV
jgi:hypothetical protein